MVVSDEMGDIPAGNLKGLGLYYSDTRFLSAYEFRLNGLQPILLSPSGHQLEFFGQQRPVEENEQGITLSYVGLDGVKRRTEVFLHRQPSRRHGNRVFYDIHLESKETIILLIDIIPGLGTDDPALEYLYDDALTALQTSYRRWNSQTTTTRTATALLDRGLIRRSQMDLRVPVEESDSGMP